MARNPNIPVSSRKLFPVIHDWNWANDMSGNTGIKMADVLADLDEDWDWYELSANPGITIRDIEAHPDLPWKWFWISNNPNINMKFVLSHQDKNELWNWPWLSRNPGITMNDILSNLDKPWNWSYISLNPNLTAEMVIAHPEKGWNFDNISSNLFLQHYWIRSCSIRNMAIIRADNRRKTYKEVIDMNSAIYKDLSRVINDYL